MTDEDWALSDPYFRDTFLRWVNGTRPAVADAGVLQECVRRGWLDRSMQVTERGREVAKKASGQ